MGRWGKRFAELGIAGIRKTGDAPGRHPPAQALLRQQIPDGLAEIFDRALTLLVEVVKKFAQTSRPAKCKQTSGDGPSRSIPAEIKRAVYTRDGAQLLRGGARLRSGLHGALPEGAAHVANGYR